MFMITVLGLCVLSVLVLNCMFELLASFGQEGLAGGYLISAETTAKSVYIISVYFIVRPLRLISEV